MTALRMRLEAFAGGYGSELTPSEVRELADELNRMAGQDGAAIIAAERHRQVSQEGYSADHDDAHDGGQLARAAACYALYAGGVWTLPGRGEIGRGWPWPGWNWKPGGDAEHTLAKAGALIAAEIDRLQRERRRNDGQQSPA